MALFDKKNKTTIAELEEYYANQQGSASTVKTWSMAFLSLMITAGIVVAVFFSIRWAWGAIRSDDTGTVAVTGVEDKTIRVAEDGTITGDLSQLDNNSGEVSGSTSTTSRETVEPNGVVSGEAATTERATASTTQPSTPTAQSPAPTSTPAQSTTPRPNQTATPAVAGSTTSIPNTGMSSIALFAPALAMVAGYIFSRSKQLRNNSK
jgi:hypothetical protein